MDSLSPQLEQLVEERLGRAPRGLRAVAVSDGEGNPVVIRVASIVDGRPFPTLFWLIDPAINLRIDREEAGGTIAGLQRLIDGDESLREQMAEDHRAHIALRDSYLTPEDRSAIARGGFEDALSGRGIGGIADPARIRCLHTWYAAHLVVPNAIGRLLDERWAPQSDRGG